MTPKKRTKRPKSAGESAGVQVPALVPQPHGGALLTGGMPGNRGGRRPLGLAKQMAKEAMPVAVEKVRGIVEGEKSKPTDVIQAASFLHKMAGEEEDDRSKPDFWRYADEAIKLYAPEQADAIYAYVKQALSPIKSEGL